MNKNDLPVTAQIHQILTPLVTFNHATEATLAIYRVPVAKVHNYVIETTLAVDRVPIAKDENGGPKGIENFVNAAPHK